MSELDFLSRYPTTTIETAVHYLRIRPRHVGFVRADLPMQVPHLGLLAGYAVTAAVSTNEAKPFGARESFDYWNYVAHIAGPKVAVNVDIDPEPAIGSAFGRVTANAVKAFGCRGVVTNGAVRDIDDIERIGFHVFCKRLTVGHGTPHTVDFGKPVTLGGATINPGDVVCADRHGIIAFPTSALLHMEEALAEAERRVAPVISYCQQPGATPAGLAEVTAKHMKNLPPWEPRKKA